MRKPLYRHAQRQLRDYITENSLGPGAALPPEAVLAEELGMSRLSLREATRSLETVGVINARPGRGLFVSEFSFAPILDQLPYSQAIEGRSLIEVLQVREALEVGLIVTAAASITDADLADLDAIVDDMAQAQESGQSTAEADRRFHARLLAGIGNPLVASLIELFWELFYRLEADLASGPAHPVEPHRAVLDAIRSGDPDRMRDAVSHHFDGIRQAVSSGFNQGNENEDEK